MTKVVEGGEATADQFGFRLAGSQSSWTYPDPQTDYVIFDNLSPDLYSVEESDVEGYHQTDSTCGDVEVVADEEATCTIVNTKQEQEEEPGETGEPQITIDKSVDLDFVNPGSVVTYTIVVSNTGDATAEDVELTDSLDSGFSYVPGSTKIDGVTAADPTGSNPFAWNLGDLAEGESITLTYQAKVAADALEDTYCNWAEVGDASDSVCLDLRVPELPVGGDDTEEPEVLSAETLPATGAGVLNSVIPSVFGFLTSLGYVLWDRKRTRAA